MPTQSLNLASFKRSEVSIGEPPHASNSKARSRGTPRDHKVLATVQGAWEFLCGCAKKYRRLMKTRQAVSELNALSDHALKDIGVSRNEIEFRVNQATPSE
jgi:uncharacterized protein YjiS (DUF1127 family)